MMLEIGASSRLTFGAKLGSLHLNDMWAAFSRRFLTREFCCFLLIGLLCTLLYLVVFGYAKKASVPAVAANGLALACAAGPNFIANRALTFQARGGSVLKQAGQYLVFYVLGIGASTLAFATFLALWASPPRDVESIAALSSVGMSTMIRYVALRYLVFPAVDSASIAGRSARPTTPRSAWSPASDDDQARFAA